MAGFCVVLGLTGCQQSVYKAGNLPPELMATAATRTNRVDLAKLAKPGMHSELIYPGDVIDVAIATGVEQRVPLKWSLRVSEQGEVGIPLVGNVRVAGLMMPQAEQAIRHASVTRQIYRDPHVSVLLNQRKTVRVTVVGAVEKPGSYQLPAANSDLLSALTAAGGMTDKASTIVEVRNVNDASPTRFASNGQLQSITANDSVRIDLIQASQGIQPEYQISDGSVVMVREKDPTTIQVIGLVRKADQFKIDPGEDVRLLDAIALAGGRTLQIADKVQIIRSLDNTTEPVVISASVSEAKKGGAANVLLAPGDVVSVEETPLTFTVGTIQNFIRFGFNAAVPGL